MKHRNRSAAARKGARTKGPVVRRRAGHKAVAGLPTDTLSPRALSRQGREAAAMRSAADRSRAAKRGVRTKGATLRRQAARKAARTRSRHS
jgi:hypothetical protein